MSNAFSKFNKVLDRAEDKLSQDCPFDIHKANTKYIMTLLIVPVIIAVPSAILCYFVHISWVYFFLGIAVFTVIHAAGFDRPVIWRLRAAFFDTQCLYEVAKWKEHNPFKYIKLIHTDAVTLSFAGFSEDWKLIAHGDLMLKASQLGHPEAIFEIGMKKTAGKYQEVESTAHEMILSAAQSGSARAQAEIGSWYLNGDRIEKNTSEALIWLQRAANQNNREAICDLGEMYFHGVGVTKNRVKGIEFLKKAADGGLIHAQQKVGMILLKEGKNRSEQLIGVEYVSAAANSGHIPSKIILALLVITTETKMKPVEGYATLIYLSDSSEDARSAAADVEHKFTELEKITANQIAEELRKKHRQN